MSSRHVVILKCFATQRILKILWTTKQTAVLHYYRSLCKCMLNCRIMANVTFSPAACLLFVIINPIMVLHHRLLTSAQEDILFGCNPYYRINCHCKSLLIHWLLPKNPLHHKAPFLRWFSANKLCIMCLWKHIEVQFTNQHKQDSGRGRRKAIHFGNCRYY